MGLLADVFSYGDTLKRRLGGLLSDPAGTVDLGVRRFAEDQNKLLSLMDQSGYTPGAQSVLQTPQDKARARAQLSDNALETYGGLLGMIKTPFGRIPETAKEIDNFADQLRRRGKAAGHVVDSGSSNVSGSRYVTFKNPGGTDLQVRLSNHADHYPNQLAGTGERFSVDPASGNTFEMAKQWLKDGGVDVSRKAKVDVPVWIQNNPEYMRKLPEAMKRAGKYSSPSDGEEFWRAVATYLVM